MWVLSLVAEHGLLGAQAQWLWHTGLVALRHVGSSQTRNQTSVPCIARWILNYWITREALGICLLENITHTPIV